MKQILLATAFAFILFSCNTNHRITDPRDYERYLRNAEVNQKLTDIDSEISFWKNRLLRVDDDIVSRSKLAGLLERRFEYSGNICEIHQADSIYKLVNIVQSINSSSTFRSLAGNCIKQHKFRQAQLYIDSALALGDDKYLTLLVDFDIAIELGNKYRAKNALRLLGNRKSFDYLIRASKYKDHIEGNLDEAIILMEKASKEVENNEALALWTISNLADMYGHANRLTESYQCYLQVLAKDHEYHHALRGIAWLAFSADKNPAEARRIINYIKEQHPVPDYDLLLAEIADYEGNHKEKTAHLNNFFEAVTDSSYGDMYNKYLFNVQADVLNNLDNAAAIAKKEVENRPTPEAYSWLAWSYLKSGETDKASQIARAHVERKSFEPEVIYRLGIIYKKLGDKNRAKKYLLDAKNSAYELGPLSASEISAALNSF